MLSYQHSYHAGNLADIHKHALLCGMLEYMRRKDKPLTYIETHGGRGLYDLKSAHALKTGESEKGIQRILNEDGLRFFPLFRDIIYETRRRYGPASYPGSPMVAALMLRDGDRLYIAEKHPAEGAALKRNMGFANVAVRLQDGYEMARALVPPTPRRGLLLVDPSYEVKSEYDTAARFIGQMHKKWETGVKMLWYPILRDGRHLPMAEQMEMSGFPDFFRHEVLFDGARAHHGLIGSGMIIIQAPYIMDVLAADVKKVFEK